MHARPKCITVRLTEIEYDRLKVLAEAAKESMPQAMRRLLHEKVEQCASGKGNTYCEGWQRAEKLRGALLAITTSAYEVLRET